MDFFTDAVEIAPVLRRLRESLNEARWQDDGDRESVISREIERLEMLVEYGETYDLPF